LEHIADNARDADLAMRWGFGWSMGPFETWQAAGWQNIATAIADDIASGRAMSHAPLPSWAADPAREGVHDAQGSYSARGHRQQPRSALPVYQRQLLPERLAVEPAASRGATLWENDGVRL